MKLFINDRIRNREVNFFKEFNIQLLYNSLANTFTFKYYFNPDNQEHIDLACIGHYHEAQLEHNGETLLTGYILNEKFNDSDKKEITSFAGYSLTGVLQDCQIPPELYPLQSNKLSLKEIADKLVKPFGIKVVVDPAVLSKVNEVFEQTTAKESQTIGAYLDELSRQKGVVLSHTEKGELLFTRANTSGNPILNFDGGIPFTSMELEFQGQGMHSHITVVKQADMDGGNAGEYTIKNPYVPFVFRPKVIMQSSGTDVDSETVAKAALASELRGLKLIITTDRWEVDGKVIKPNNIIKVLNPEVYLFKPSRWYIESVQLKGNETQTVAILTCVLPEAYSNEKPKYLFEGINLHG